MRTTAYLKWAALFLLMTVAPVWALQQDEPADLKMYRDIYAPETPTPKRIELCETFLADTSPVFWDSTYRPSVFLNLYTAYKDAKDWVKLIDLADRMEKVVPKIPSGDKVSFYLDAMRVASVELKKIDKAIELGKKVLALDKNNMNALLTLSTAIPPLPSDAEAQIPIFTEIIEYAKRVLGLDRPEAIPPDQWQNIRRAVEIQAQTLEATILLTRKDFVACAEAYEALTRLEPKNTIAFYRLGLCHYNQALAANRAAVEANTEYRDFVNECNKTLSCSSEENKVKDQELEKAEKAALADFEVKRNRAMDAFARCVAIGGVGQEVTASRAELEKLYKLPPSPPGTMDEYVAQRRKEMGV